MGWCLGCCQGGCYPSTGGSTESARPPAVRCGSCIGHVLPCTLTNILLPPPHPPPKGAERLKEALTALGLKCGGTLRQRAERLMQAKGKKVEELDRSLFAKGAAPAVSRPAGARSRVLDGMGCWLVSLLKGPRTPLN